VAPELKKPRSGAREPLKPSDITSEDLVLESVILDKNGEPTERMK